MADKNNKITRKMKQISSKMNLGLAGLVIFVLLFGLANHSLNPAFANENISHEPTKKTEFTDSHKFNAKVSIDKSMETKIKEAKEKLQAEIKHLKETPKSKGYSE